MNSTPRLQVAVVGPGAEADELLCAAAADVGRLLAAAGAVVVTGGRDGVMAAAARGAREAGGIAVGLLPGTARSEGNADLDVCVPTGLGEGRNALVVAAADALVAVGGSWGTLSEVALACRTGRPVVALSSWSVSDAEGRPVVQGITPAADPAEAVSAVLAALGREADHT